MKHANDQLLRRQCPARYLAPRVESGAELPVKVSSNTNTFEDVAQLLESAVSRSTNAIERKRVWVYSTILTNFLGQIDKVVVRLIWSARADHL